MCLFKFIFKGFYCGFCLIFVGYGYGIFYYLQREKNESFFLSYSGIKKIVIKNSLGNLFFVYLLQKILIFIRKLKLEGIFVSKFW